MRITLVRHGETTGQSSIRYYGATDVPLSETGEAQMRRVGTALVGERFDAIFCSRLRRSRDAVALVGGDRLLPTPVAEFDEVDFGNWEGWTHEEIAARDPVNYQRWQTGGDAFTYPGGESRQAFIRRVGRGLANVLANQSAGNLLMVLHRGVIAVILGELLRLPSERRRVLAIDLASIHVVSCNAGRWRSECLNRLDHLRGSTGDQPVR